MARSNSALNRFVALTCGLVLSALYTLVAVVSVYAQTGGTQIGAVICYSEVPVLQITQPALDYVTNVPTIPLEGTAQYTSQIDIVINGNYSHSVAIGFNGVLQTQVSLQEGTNTITLQAYFSCNGTSAEEDIIVEYSPLVTPTTPGGTDTNVPQPGTDSSDGSPVGTSRLQKVVEKVIENLGLDPEKPGEQAQTFNPSFVKIAFSWVIFSAILVLLSSLFSGIYIVGHLAAKLRKRGITPESRVYLLARFLIILLILLLAYILAS